MLTSRIVICWNILPEKSLFSIMILPWRFFEWWGCWIMVFWFILYSIIIFFLVVFVVPFVFLFSFFFVIKWFVFSPKFRSLNSIKTNVILALILFSLYLYHTTKNVLIVYAEKMKMIPESVNFVYL